MRSRAIFIIFAISMLLCVACTTKKPVIPEQGTETEHEIADNTAAPIDVILGNTEDDILVMNTEEQEATSAAGENVKIYYNGKDFEHLMVREEAISQKNPETLLTALAMHNIVTLDTKNLSFALNKTEDNKVRVYLNLNKKFEAYINTMSEGSERVIVAALVDTFLENYKADEMVITIEGEVLKTYHNTYDEPIVKSGFEVEVAEPKKESYIDKISEEK